MDKLSQAHALADAMRCAAVAKDWDALAEANAAVEARLHAWSGKREWSAADRDAIATLLREHEDAVKLCIDALESAARNLADMRAHREAHIAYAIDHGAGA